MPLDFQRARPLVQNGPHWVYDRESRPMPLNLRTTRERLQSFDFRPLFVEDLGWEPAADRKSEKAATKDCACSLKPVSRLSGVGVFEITTDLGKFGIHTTRKRLIQVQRELKAGGQPFRAFDVINLGRYERPAYLNVAGGLTDKKKQQALARKDRDLILKARGAERLRGGSTGFVAEGAETVQGQSGAYCLLPLPATLERRGDRGASDKNPPPLPGPLLHPMEEREKSRRSHDATFRGKQGNQLVVIDPIKLPVERLREPVTAG